MISKNSFLVNMKENLKRRKGIAVLYSIIFLLVYPVGLSLLFTAMRDNPNIRERMTSTLSMYLGMNILTALLVTLSAVSCAVQGFSYLFKKQKLDMYMSVPVSKGRRFAVIYINGILLYAIPHFASVIISLCIGAGNGVFIGKVIKTVIFSCLSYLLYYIAVYNITIVAVMMTGNTLLALCATGIFLFYEGAVKLILGGMNAIYFRTYSSYSNEMWYRFYFSPALLLGKIFIEDDMSHQNVPYLLEKFGIILAQTAVLAVIAGAIGYWLYAVRPAESCNKAIAFRKTRPFIKIALMVPAALVVGIAFYVLTDNTNMAILGFVLGIVLSHGILEVIFEYDLKAIFKSYQSTAVGTLFVFGIFAFYRFDLTGYDKWVPDPKQVESLAFSGHSLSFSSAYDLEAGTYINGSDYMLDHMQITDTESFCALMESAAGYGRGTWEEEEKILWITVKYRMKNGREKYRKMPIPYEKHKEELNRLVSGEEYQKAAFQILDEELTDRVLLEKISFRNGVTEKEAEQQDMEKILQAYKEDLEHYDMETVAEQYPAGVINFRFLMEFDYVEERYGGREHSLYYFMPVYETFERTMSYAKEKGLLEDWKQSISDIDSITVTSYRREEDEWTEREYGDNAEIAALLPALIPGELANYRTFSDEKSHNYSAIVYYTINGENEAKEYESYYFEIDSEKLPDFVK